MKFFFCSVFLIITMCVFAQPMEWRWAKKISHEIRSCTFREDSERNVVVIGLFRDSASIGNAKLKGDKNSLFIAKYTQAGEQIWAKKIGECSGYIEYYFECDSWGNSYLAGGYCDSIFSVGNSKFIDSGGATCHSFIIKINSLGSVDWAKVINNTGRNSITSVDVNEAGLIGFVGIYMGKDLDWQGYKLPTFKPSWGSDLRTFYGVLDPTGSIKYFRHTTENDDSYPFKAVMDKHGSIQVISGIGATSAERYTRIIRFDPSGQLKWTYMDWSKNFASSSMALDEEGNTFFTINSNLIKIDNNGQRLWERALHSGHWTHFFVGDLTTDRMGGVIGIGYYLADSLTLDGVTLSPGPPSYMDWSVFVIKLNSSGNTQWLHGTTGDCGNLGYCVQVTSDDIVYVGGRTFCPQISFGNHPIPTFPKSPDGAFFLARLDNGNYTTLDEWTESSCRIFPNPATNVMNLEFIKAPTDFSFVNAGGIEVLRGRINRSTQAMSVDVGSLPKGIYVLTLRYENTIQRKKIFIQ